MHLPPPPGTSNRRYGEERRCSRITSCLEPVLPVPLFLYNSGEYFYLLFSKGSFFSSLIVETHFLWKLQCILRGISSHPTFVHPEVIVCQFLFSKWEGVMPFMHTLYIYIHTRRAWRLQRQLDNLPKWLNIPLAQWGKFLFFFLVCLFVWMCVTCYVCVRGGEGIRITHCFLVYIEADYLGRL